jgi:hypothetical protein
MYAKQWEHFLHLLWSPWGLFVICLSARVFIPLTVRGSAANCAVGVSNTLTLRAQRFEASSGSILTKFLLTPASISFLGFGPRQTYAVRLILIRNMKYIIWKLHTSMINVLSRKVIKLYFNCIESRGYVYSIKVKVKLFLCLINYALRHGGVWGSGCVDPHFLDLGNRWRWVVSFTSLPLYLQGKSPRYPMNRSLGRPQSRSGRRREEKILDPIGTRTSTPWSSSLQPVAMPTELSRLSKIKFSICFQSKISTVNIIANDLRISGKRHRLENLCFHSVLVHLGAVARFE